MKILYRGKLRQEGNFWGEKNSPGARLSWFEHPFLNDYTSSFMHGIDTHWFYWLKKKYLIDKKRILSLGCGFGNLERLLKGEGIGKNIDAYDISENAIETAKRLAQEENITGINYEVRDINRIKLEERSYDCVMVHFALHHVQELEHVMLEVEKALVPEGLFIYLEFVGPSRFQWQEEQMEIANTLLEILPERYKHMKPYGNFLKEKISRPDPSELEAASPFEAIRSQEIISITHRYFHVMEIHPMGGTLLHPLFHGIVDNFNQENEMDKTFLKVLCYIEKTLIDEGVLSSDFALVVARKKNRHPIRTRMSDYTD